MLARPKPLGESNTAIRLRTHLENLRSYLVDLEALAHAARETLDQLPYMPRSSGPDAPDLEVRLNYGRLQAMVTATATSARDVLIACDEMLEDPGEPPDDEDDEDGGSDEPSGSSGNGGSNVSGAGHMPQARQDFGAAERLDAPGFSDDGGAEPGLIESGVPGAPCVPRTRQSRGASCSTWLPGRPSWCPSWLVARMSRSSPRPRCERYGEAPACSLAANLKQEHGGRRYGAELKREVVEHAFTRQGERATIREIAEELGLSAGLLGKWLGHARLRF